MADTTKISLEQARAIAQAVQLDLPPERLKSLSAMLSNFLTGFERIRAIDTGDREPATLVPTKEG